MFESVDQRKDGRRLESHPISSSRAFHSGDLKTGLSQNKYMYGLKKAGTDQVSFLPVPVLMVVKVIWSTGKVNVCLVFLFHP